MAKYRMIAVCDILGFRNLVKQSTIESIVDGQLKIFHRILMFSIKHGKYPNVPDTLKTLRDQRRVGVAWFSDTVLIYALDDTDEACRNVIETLGWLLFVTIPSTSTRIRAGVAYNEIHADSSNEIFVGKAILDAYELEQAQQWAGGALTKQAAERLPSLSDPAICSYWWVYEYPVPLKAGKSNTISANVAVNWTLGIHFPHDLPWGEDSQEPTLRERTQMPDVVAKWENTRQFHREVCKHCFQDN